MSDEKRRNVIRDAFSGFFIDNVFFFLAFIDVVDLVETQEQYGILGIWLAQWISAGRSITLVHLYVYKTVATTYSKTMHQTMYVPLDYCPF